MKKFGIMIVAGEPSGDAHAARLVNALKAAAPEAEFVVFGSAGPQMRSAGVEAVVEADKLAIMGIPEIARSMPMFVETYRELVKAAGDRRPDLVVLVDFPEFNLKLARSFKKKGFKIVYYISPQLWAWRTYRYRTIKLYVDLLLTILPFEKEWYQKKGVEHVEFVGNPLVNEVHADLSKQEFTEKYGLDPAKPLIALLPGSRRKEVSMILPPMLGACRLLAMNRSDVQFVVALAAGRMSEEIAGLIGEAYAKGLTVTVVHDDTYNVLNAADAAAVASGTATLEAAIIGVPMAVVYKASGLNFRLVRPLISVEHFGLVNLVAGKRIVREYIQDDFTPAALAYELERLLEPSTNENVRQELRNAVDKLGEGGASRRAADAILRLIVY